MGDYFVRATKGKYSISEMGCINLSRSYKKTPVVKDRCNNAGLRKYWKRQAHKKERKTKGLENKSNYYRRVFDPWNICDYRLYKEKELDTDEGDPHFWERWYRRK